MSKFLKQFKIQDFSNTEFFDPTSNTIIGFVTDLEGNLNYWSRYVQFSKVLKRDESGTLKLLDHCQFIHGGDVCDRGAGDIRILKDLIGLKETYPSRVHFILGNRDVNKMRVPFVAVIKSPPKASWVHKPEDSTIKTVAERLQWMLTHTMGSPLSFEYRRSEIQALKDEESSIKSTEHAVTDKEVAQSYLDLMKPDGLLTKYLKYGSIAILIGDLLIIHGGIHSYNMGWVPFLRNAEKTVRDEKYNAEMMALATTAPVLIAPALMNDAKNKVSEQCRHNGYYEPDVIEWVKAINRFAYGEVLDYIAHCEEYLHSLQETEATSDSIWDTQGGYDHPQPGSRLVQYGMGWMPDDLLNPSVVYASYLYKGTPVQCPEKVIKWLKSFNIHRLLVGHQPNGDAPFTMDEHNFQVIMADTGYSLNTMYLENHLCKVNRYEPDIQVDHEDATEICDSDGKWMSYVTYAYNEKTKQATNATNLPPVVMPPPPPDLKQLNTSAAGSIPLPPGTDYSTSSVETASQLHRSVDRKDTRGSYCVAEVCISFPLRKGLPHQTIGSDEAEDGVTRFICGGAFGIAANEKLEGDQLHAGSSKVLLRGVLSETTAYHCELPPSNENRFIGKKTKRSEWYPKLRTEDHGSSGSGGSGVYVLAHSEGFMFKSKVIPESSIESEFN